MQVAIVQVESELRDKFSCRCRIKESAFVSFQLSVGEIVRIDCAGRRSFLCRAFPAHVWDLGLSENTVRVDDSVQIVHDNAHVKAKADGQCAIYKLDAQEITDADDLCLLRLSSSHTVIGESSDVIGDLLCDDYGVEMLHSVLRNAVVLPGAIICNRFKVQRVSSKSNSSKKYFRVLRRTSIRLVELAASDEDVQRVVRPSTVVGLEAITSRLDDLFNAFQCYIDGRYDLRLRPASGFLLHAPRGCGKSSLVRSFAARRGAKLFQLSASDLRSPFLGENEAKLREVFQCASSTERLAIILLDDIEQFCPAREDASATGARVVSQLIALLDNVRDRSANVAVMATSSEPNRIETALRRAGRLEIEIAFNAPTTEQRERILHWYTRDLRVAAEVDLHDIAKQTVGFVGADIVSLCREVAFRSERDDAQHVRKAHFSAALRAIVPSLARAVQLDLDRSLTWDSVGGMPEEKRRMQEIVQWPLQRADAFERLAIVPSRGVILHGPPGTGKTHLVKAAANVGGLSFISLDGASVYSPYLGDAEATVRRVFDLARQMTPAIVFIDELDALVGSRDIGVGSAGDGGVQQRILSTLLNEMDGFRAAKQILVVAATNRLDLIDSALLRRGRFDQHLYIGAPPDCDARLDILRVKTRQISLSDDADLAEIARRTSGFTGADLTNLVRHACFAALREGEEKVCKRHFF